MIDAAEVFCLSIVESRVSRSFPCVKVTITLRLVAVIGLDAVKDECSPARRASHRSSKLCEACPQDNIDALVIALMMRTSTQRRTVSITRMDRQDVAHFSPSTSFDELKERMDFNGC